MDIPLLGTPLPIQIIDNNIPGHTITQLSSSIHDINALQTYLQTALPSFTNLFYYPDQEVLQIQTSGTADTDAIQSLIQSYPNPEPFLSTTENIGMQPINMSSSAWKTVFVMNSPYHADKKLVQATISSAMTSPGSQQPSQYSVRVVALDTNTVLGVTSACNNDFQDQLIALSAVPDKPFSLEFQLKTSADVYVTLRSITFTYQLV